MKVITLISEDEARYEASCVLARAAPRRDAAGMKRAITALVLSSVLLVALPASADRGKDRDAVDSPGPLDIARIVHKHHPSHQHVLIHKIVMHESWRLRDLRSTLRDSRGITVTFDVNPRRGYSCIACISEREVVLVSRNGKLHATLYNHLGDPARKLAELPVWRPGLRSVAFAVDKRQLVKRARTDLDFYEWGVQTIYTRRDGDSCPRRRACFDLAPRRNDLLRHRL